MMSKKLSGMSLGWASAVLLAAVTYASVGYAQFVASPTGTTEWRFNSITGTTVDAAYGPGVMSQLGTTGDGIQTGGFNLAGDVVPNIGLSPTNFLVTTAAAGNFGAGTGYQVFSNVDGPANGHHQFTMIYDMYIPSTTTQNGFVSLYQGNATNSNDVDGFLRLTNRNMWYNGPANQYDFGEWERLVITVDADTNTANTYVDGDFESTGSVNDYVFDAGNALPFWVFSDNDGDHKPSAWANYAFVPDVILDANTISQLGGANAQGIFNVPEPASITVWSLAALVIFGLYWRRRRA